MNETKGCDIMLKFGEYGCYFSPSAKYIQAVIDARPYLTNRKWQAWGTVVKRETYYTIFDLMMSGF